MVGVGAPSWGRARIAAAFSSVGFHRMPPEFSSSASVKKPACPFLTRRTTGPSMEPRRVSERKKKMRASLLAEIAAVAKPSMTMSCTSTSPTFGRCSV